MFCPACQTVIRAQVELCPTCGDPMHPVLASDVVEVVESMDGGGTLTGDAGAAAADSTARDLVTQDARRTSFLTRLPELSVLAWQQPAVRTAVKTGAGAIALSLAMRMARQWLLGEPRRRAAAPDTLLPALGEWLSSDHGPGRQPSEHGMQVSETFIYVRHTRRL